MPAVRRGSAYAEDEVEGGPELMAGMRSGRLVGRWRNKGDDGREPEID